MAREFEYMFFLKRNREGQQVHDTTLNSMTHQEYDCGRGLPLVVQWFSIRLPTQGTRVQSLVRELESHRRWGSEARVSQLLRVARGYPLLAETGGSPVHRKEEPPCCNEKFKKIFKNLKTFIKILKNYKKIKNATKN